MFIVFAPAELDVVKTLAKVGAETAELTGFIVVCICDKLPSLNNNDIE